MSKEVLPRTLAFLVVLALLIFIPALSLAYWQGWIYWLVVSAATLALSLYFLKYDPALVRRRMHAGVMAETERPQKFIMAFASVFTIVTFLTASFDHLRQWSAVPWWLVILADAAVALGCYIMFAALRANSFAATTIKVEPDQPVVASGPYAVVRHPMYSGAVLMFLATPLALGSWWALVPAALLASTIAGRLLHEEQILARQLSGYEAYRREVPFRLIPMVW